MEVEGKKRRSSRKGSRKENEVLRGWRGGGGREEGRKERRVRERGRGGAEEKEVGREGGEEEGEGERKKGNTHQ